MSTTSDVYEVLKTYHDSLGEKEHFTGLSAAVRVQSGAILAASYGKSRREATYDDVSPQSLFQIGSNTKAFTAAATLLLESKLETFRTWYPIDAFTRCDYPELEGIGNATVQRLLSMTAAIESYDNLPEWERAYAADPTADVPARTLVDMIAGSQRQPVLAPWHYSNTGYLITQIILDRLAPRVGFADHRALIGRIVESAGLHDTFYTTHMYPEPVAARLVGGYYYNDEPGLQPLRGQDVTKFSLSWAQSAGAVASTPTDLVKWAHQLYVERTILPSLQFAELLELRSQKTGHIIAEVSADDPAGFGLGVAHVYDPSYPDRAQRFWVYKGETLGFRALHGYWPALDLTIAFCINSRCTKTNDQSNGLLKTLLLAALR